MISKVQIKNYKSIQSQEFELKKINLFVGANNSGKTSFISAIHFAITSFWRLGMERLTHNKQSNEKVTQLNEEDLLFLPTKTLSDLVHGSLLGYHSQAAKEDIKYFDIQLENKERGKTSLNIYRSNTKGYSFRVDYFNDKEKDNFTNFLLNYFKEEPYSLYSFYAPGLSGIPVDEHELGKGLLREAAMKPAQASMILRNLLYQIWKKQEKQNKKYDPRSFDDFKKEFRSIFDFIKSDLKHDSSIDNRFHKIWYEQEKQKKQDKKNNYGPFNDLKKALGIIFDDIKLDLIYNSNKDKSIQITIGKYSLDLMGVGFLQILQILAIRYLYEPKIMILDEPDAHLHPGQQKQLFKLFEKWATDEKNPTQIIISTHSKTFIEEAEKVDNNIVKIKRVFKGKLYDFNWNEWEQDGGDVGLSEEDKIRLKNSKKNFVITEDENKSLLKDILINHSFDMDNLEILSSQGKDKLKEYVNNVSDVVKTNILVHCDSDNKEKESIKELSNDKVKVWFTNSDNPDTEIRYKEIESYILEFNNLKKQIKGALKINDGEELKEILKTINESEPFIETYTKPLKEQDTIKRDEIIKQFKNSNLEGKIKKMMSDDGVKHKKSLEIIQDILKANYSDRDFNITTQLYFPLEIKKLNELGNELGMLKK